MIITPLTAETSPLGIALAKLVAISSLVVAVLLQVFVGSSAQALQVQEMAFLEGEGGGRIWGTGLVFGLNGTGDEDSLPRARQIAALMQRAGAEVPNLEEILEAANVAMVMVTADIPAQGAKHGERLDVRVQALYNAGSLRGGELFITPLQGPLPGFGVLASSSGTIEIEDPSTPTVGIVRGGAMVTHEIRNQVIQPDGSFTLNIKTAYAGWTTVKLLADTINQHRAGFLDTSGRVAYAVDAKSIRVMIPEEELADPANFIGDILSVEMSPTLLDLPARVIVNPRTQSIVVTGDVQISPAVIAHENLVVTTVTPPIEPDENQPRIDRTNAVAVDTLGNERAAANLADLLEAFKRLDVPVDDQIGLLKQLHAVGHLHAEFITE